MTNTVGMDVGQGSKQLIHVELEGKGGREARERERERERERGIIHASKCNTSTCNVIQRHVHVTLYFLLHVYCIHVHVHVHCTRIYYTTMQ